MPEQPTEEQKQQMAAEQEAVNNRVGRIKNRILVLSGKGGVGKSTVAASLATSLAEQGCKTGLLDVDIHGPSIPQLVGLTGLPPGLEGTGATEEELQPMRAADNLHVMSIGFLLENPEQAVIWRGPMKYNLIKQFLKDVAWGDLDYLVVDSPPGTGDEPLAVAQMLGSPSHALVVTTPQELSVSDVRRCVTFCRKVEVSLLGVVENMSGFICPHCGVETNIFDSGGGQSMAEKMNIPFLGKIPLDPHIVAAGDSGVPYSQAVAETPAKQSLETVTAKITTSLKA
mgnify:CR=1 FL=1